MEKKTGDDFEFVVKGYKGFTHDTFDNRIDKKSQTMKKQLSILKNSKQCWPLLLKQKTGLCFIAIPRIFLSFGSIRNYILKCQKLHDKIKLVIEFRDSSVAKPRTFEFLRYNNLGFCIVDEPRLPRLMSFVQE